MAQYLNVTQFKKELVYKEEYSNPQFLEDHVLIDFFRSNDILKPQSLGQKNSSVFIVCYYYKEGKIQMVPTESDHTQVSSDGMHDWQHSRITDMINAKAKKVTEAAQAQGGISHEAIFAKITGLSLEVATTIIKTAGGLEQAGALFMEKMNDALDRINIKCGEIFGRKGPTDEDIKARRADLASAGLESKRVLQAVSRQPDRERERALRDEVMAGLLAVPSFMAGKIAPTEKVSNETDLAYITDTEFDLESQAAESEDDRFTRIVAMADQGLEPGARRWVARHSGSHGVLEDKYVLVDRRPPPGLSAAPHPTLVDALNQPVDKEAYDKLTHEQVDPADKDRKKRLGEALKRLKKGITAAAVTVDHGAMGMEQVAADNPSTVSISNIVTQKVYDTGRAYSVDSIMADKNKNFAIGVFVNIPGQPIDVQIIRPVVLPGVQHTDEVTVSNTVKFYRYEGDAAPVGGGVGGAPRDFDKVDAATGDPEFVPSISNLTLMVLKGELTKIQAILAKYVADRVAILPHILYLLDTEKYGDLIYFFLTHDGRPFYDNIKLKIHLNTGTSQYIQVPGIFSTKHLGKRIILMVLPFDLDPEAMKLAQTAAQTAKNRREKAAREAAVKAEKSRKDETTATQKGERRSRGKEVRGHGAEALEDERKKYLANMTVADAASKSVDELKKALKLLLITSTDAKKILKLERAPNRPNLLKLLGDIITMADTHADGWNTIKQLTDNKVEPKLIDALAILYDLRMVHVGTPIPPDGMIEAEEDEDEARSRSRSRGSRSPSRDRRSDTGNEADGEGSSSNSADDDYDDEDDDDEDVFSLPAAAAAAAPGFLPPAAAAAAPGFLPPAAAAPWFSQPAAAAAEYTSLEDALGRGILKKKFKKRPTRKRRKPARRPTRKRRKPARRPTRKRPARRPTKRRPTRKRPTRRPTRKRPARRPTKRPTKRPTRRPTKRR